MKKVYIIILIIICHKMAFAQEDLRAYYQSIKQADSLHNIVDFKNSAIAFSKAFKINNWKAEKMDRYNAACAWAKGGFSDSAFYHLELFNQNSKSNNYDMTVEDRDFISLHPDSRWDKLIASLKLRKDIAEVNLNKPLRDKLDSIYIDDQFYRGLLDGIDKKYGWDSKEMRHHWEIINQKDSINLIQVKLILDQFGWLGPDIVGNRGNSTLFLVIQHSNQITQEKYLPMMREAVKNGQAPSNNLALLEDRVAIGQGKRQIYGSQIAKDSETGMHYVMPLEDPDHVDKRRKEVGLEPIADYVGHWNIKWEAESYKKDLAKIEAKMKKK